MGDAQHCFRLQNYNDAIAILSGLNAIPVYRLKKTWAVCGAAALRAHTHALTRVRARAAAGHAQAAGHLSRHPE
jgi:hypothetical protein